MTTQTAVAASPDDDDGPLVGHVIDHDLDPRVKVITLVNDAFMTDPTRCDAPWCGELLPAGHDQSRARGAATCDSSCAQRLSRWRRAQHLSN